MVLEKIKVNDVDFVEDIDRDYDVIKIRDVLIRQGYRVNFETARRLWEEFSESVAVSWLALPETEEEIWEEISRVIE